MKTNYLPNSTPTGALHRLAALAACALLAAASVACAGSGQDPAADERMRELESKTSALEQSLSALEDENAELRNVIADLQQAQTDFMDSQQTAEAASKRGAEVEDSQQGREAQLSALQQGQARTAERLDELEARLQELEEAGFNAVWELFDLEQWDKGKDEAFLMPDGTPAEMTAQLATDAGGVVHYVDHPGRGDRTVLVTPVEFTDGETPLIVSLHGYGGNSADHAGYIPLHERVNSDGFALLMPTGTIDGEGNPFWNPTDECCDGGKAGEDDVAYLTGLVAEANKVKRFGPVYFFGYSNGGFMAHHVACKGLPGLRAVASLAGTSYVDAASCEGAPPVSALHVHGTDDQVILFDGDRSEPDPKHDGDPAFYIGAQQMTMRWGERAGCDWPDDPRPYATLDLDQWVHGAETQAFRLESGCAEGVGIELWVGIGSSHSPAYGEAFVDALLTWLLSQN